MNTSSIGDRIRALREFRDITQEALADESKVSIDTIRKLEQNRRQSARIGTLRSLARALDVQLERLVGQPTVTKELTPDGGLLAMRDAIQDPGSLPGVLGYEDLEDPPNPAEWARQVQAATDTYWAGGYSELAAILPGLLRDGRATVRQHDTEGVWRDLALTYQLAASLSTQAGHPDWAYTAVEKQLAAAARASDPLLEGMGVSTLSWVLLRQGRWEQARDIAERKADQLEPPRRRATADQLAVYGNLLIAAATPAARADHHDEAMQLLTLAESAAVQSGPVKTYGTAFSVTDVRTQQVNIALAGATGRPDVALTASAGVDLATISRPVHSASYRVDVAQARYQTGDSEGALNLLLAVEEDQPEWIRFQAGAAATVREMLEAERRRNRMLRGLASRLGVDPAL
ncbi:MULTISPECIES: helix-turn-helix domain-containing protein [unclassified Streptomyces]|uniref:helix-turn-helix domain-containing protein n=1 Tax=unclassified Streptomyces TaxID=2593676 RepID=UPI00081E7282|nr:MULTISPECIES: helix-turn-helix transcriptional regulator [unclassified Streptomyces]MYR93113.1 helix-turn-helix domain-containing protein [Streptomyces sp. SID4937]SCD46615.1 Transcriptional regulator, contains XRE-family HTH domain [Streptomyces sp. ScaeMP-e83]